jgi:hypothetical protein
MRTSCRIANRFDLEFFPAWLDGVYIDAHPRNSGPRRDARWDVAIFCPW